MPIYVFVCPKCDNRFEKLVRKMDIQTTDCPECGEPADKIMAPVSPFVWGKGGAWN